MDGGILYYKTDDLLYKINGTRVIEINLGSYEYSIISVCVGNVLNIPMEVPPARAKKSSKKEFDKYYKEFMAKLKKAE